MGSSISLTQYWSLHFTPLSPMWIISTKHPWGSHALRASLSTTHDRTKSHTSRVFTLTQTNKFAINAVEYLGTSFYNAHLLVLVYGVHLTVPSKHTSLHYLRGQHQRQRQHSFQHQQQLCRAKPLRARPHSHRRNRLRIIPALKCDLDTRDPGLFEILTGAFA